MAKKKGKKKGEQLELIDVQPENVKHIIEVARTYKKSMARRLKELADETKLKHKIIELVDAANLQPLKGGVIRFECDGVEISITPQDRQVKVKEKL